MLRKLTLWLLGLLFGSSTSATSITPLTTLAAIIGSITLGNVLLFVLVLFLIIIFLRILLFAIELFLLISDLFDTILVISFLPPVLVVSDFVLFFLFLLLWVLTTSSSALATPSFAITATPLAVSTSLMVTTAPLVVATTSLALFTSLVDCFFFIDDFAQILCFIDNLSGGINLLLLVVLEPWRAIGTEVESHFLSVLLRCLLVVPTLLILLVAARPILSFLFLRVLLSHHLFHFHHLFIQFGFFVTVLFENRLLFLQVNLHLLSQGQDIIFGPVLKVFVVVHKESICLKSLFFFVDKEHKPDFIIFVVFITVFHHNCIFDIAGSKSIKFFHHLSCDFSV